MQLEFASRWATIVIAFVAGGIALRAGGSVFAPLAFGLVLGIVMSPLSDFVDRIGLPRVFSALLSIIVAGGLITLLVIFIEPQISRAVRRAPEIMAELGVLLDGMQDLIRGIDNVSEEVSEAINENGVAGDEADAVPVRVPGAFDALTLAPSIIAQLLIVIGAFFFFLISRHEIYEWVARRRDGESEGPSASTLKGAERMVARYFLTITIINATLGLLVGIVFYAIGMPAPFAWGLIAAMLNYILYIGPAIFAVSALLGGVLAFDGALGVLPAALYVSMNACEGNFITPTLVGKNMQVNPLLVFLSLIFWLWLWGPLGGIIAIPILLYVLAIVSGFGMSQTISFGTAGRSRPKRSAGVGS